MPLQTVYNDTMAPGAVGQIANMIPSTLISRNVEAAAGIAFGLAVVQGADDYGVDIAAAETAFVGITVRERSTDGDIFAENDSARLMTQGAIWVQPTEAVDAGDIVHVLAGGTFAKIGGNLYAGARWDTSSDGTAGALAIVRLS